MNIFSKKESAQLAVDSAEAANNFQLKREREEKRASELEKSNAALKEAETVLLADNARLTEKKEELSADVSVAKEKLGTSKMEKEKLDEDVLAKKAKLLELRDKLVGERAEFEKEKAEEKKEFGEKMAEAKNKFERLDNENGEFENVITAKKTKIAGLKQREVELQNKIDLKIRTADELSDKEEALEEITLTLALKKYELGEELAEEEKAILKRKDLPTPIQKVHADKIIGYEAEEEQAKQKVVVANTDAEAAIKKLDEYTLPIIRFSLEKQKLSQIIKKAKRVVENAGLNFPSFPGYDA